MGMKRSDLTVLARLLVEDATSAIGWYLAACVAGAALTALIWHIA